MNINLLDSPCESYFSAENPFKSSYTAKWWCISFDWILKYNFQFLFHYFPLSDLCVLLLCQGSGEIREVYETTIVIFVAPVEVVGSQEYNGSCESERIMDSCNQPKKYIYVYKSTITLCRVPTNTFLFVFSYTRQSFSYNRISSSSKLCCMKNIFILFFFSAYIYVSKNEDISP